MPQAAAASPPRRASAKKRGEGKPAKSARASGAARARFSLGRFFPQLSFWRLFRFAFYWGVVAAVWAGVAGLVLAAYFAWGLPDPDQAFEHTRRPMVSVLAADGTEIARAGDLYGQAVRLADLPAALPAAVLATEDRRFYDHFGLDVWGLARAVWVNARAGRIRQGGSTITQQVAKNLFLSPERSLARKAREALLAFWLESRFTKDQILEVYLNRVYLGGGAYGVDAAARLYFSKSARDLNVYESAMIAGLLKAPSRYNPRADPAAARKRAGQVLANMAAAGYLTKSELAKARAGGGGAAVRNPNGFAKYFADWALAAMPAHTAGDADVVLETTLDPALQRAVERIVREALAASAAAGPRVQAAVVVLDGSGAVRAMLGGRDYRQSSFNRAVDARRQPGSAFKPFVYLAALESGMRPDDILNDAPLQIDGWAPKNFSGRYEGPVTMAHALAHSINTPAVRAARRAGAANVREVAERLGAGRGFADDLGLALGTQEVTLLNLAQAYAPFANGGYGVIAHGVRRVKGRGGDGETLVYERQGGGPGRVIAPKNAADMNRMLAGAAEHGTARAARPPGAPPGAVGGKTGTSQDHRDAWFAGFAAGRVVAVWIGRDDAAPMKDITGGGLPAQIAGRVLAAAQGGRAWKLLPGLAAAPETMPAPGAGPEIQQPPADGGGLLDGVLRFLSGG